MDETALLERCRSLSVSGLGFDTIWSKFLVGHPLTVGHMVRPARGQWILVPLVSGRAIEFDLGSGEWRLRERLKI
jgi:hypothetical protein